MRSVLVTGGAGFIGSHFVEHILATHRDYRVIILDKLTYAGNEKHLRDTMAGASGRLEFVEGDFAEEGLARWVLERYQCDLIVHFASESHVERSIETPTLFWENNAHGSALLLEVARLKQVKRFLLISSVEVYGAQQSKGEALWREDDVTRPATPYAAAKVAAEAWATAYWPSFDLPVVITRCCNNYGPRQHSEKQLPTFITAALRGEPLPVHGDGEHLRQWLYVTDHCRALDMLLHADEQKVAGEIFNIGSGPQGERSTLENAQAVLECLGQDAGICHIPDRKPSLRRLALDSSKLEQRLGWKPLVRFEEGLARTLEFYREEIGKQPPPQREQPPSPEPADDRTLEAVG